MNKFFVLVVFCMLLAISLVSAFSIYDYITGNVVAESNLVAHYKLDGDLSNSVTLGFPLDDYPDMVYIDGGGLETYVSGKQGEGIQYLGNAFGNDYLRIPSPSFNLNAYTVAMWVRLDNLPDNRANLFFNLNGEGLYPRAMVYSSGKVALQMRGSSSSVTVTSNAPVITANTWHHIIFTYGGAVGRIYVDGSQVVSSGGLNPQLGKGSGHVNIGYDPDSEAFLAGQGITTSTIPIGIIDDIRIYNKKFNNNEPNELYREVGGTAPTAPVCGNGNVEIGEACDNGGSNGACPATCSTSCTRNTCAGATCGNGVIEAGESCDDGDNTAGDGCGIFCTVETGYTCTGEPSVCTRGMTRPTNPCADGSCGVDITSSITDSSFNSPITRGGSQSNLWISSSSGAGSSTGGGILSVTPGTSSTRALVFQRLDLSSQGAGTYTLCAKGKPRPEATGHFEVEIHTAGIVLNSLSARSDGFHCVSSDLTSIQLRAAILVLAADPTNTGLVEEVLLYKKGTTGPTDYTCRITAPQKTRVRAITGDNAKQEFKFRFTGSPTHYVMVVADYDQSRGASTDPSVREAADNLELCRFSPPDTTPGSVHIIDNSGVISGTGEQTVLCDWRANGGKSVLDGTSNLEFGSTNDILLFVTDNPSDPSRLVTCDQSGSEAIQLLEVTNREGSMDKNAGCEVNDKKFKIGHRQGRDNTYCASDETYKPQKALEASCDVSWECRSNLCIDGVCTTPERELEGIKADIEETQGLLDTLLGLVKGLICTISLGTSPFCDDSIAGSGLFRGEVDNGEVTTTILDDITYSIRASDISSSSSADVCVTVGSAEEVCFNNRDEGDPPITNQLSNGVCLGIREIIYSSRVESVDSIRFDIGKKVCLYGEGWSTTNIICTDTDVMSNSRTGRTYGLNGTASGGGIVRGDECAGVNTLIESYCLNGVVETVSYSCGVGMICETTNEISIGKGRCVLSSPTSNPCANNACGEDVSSLVNDPNFANALSSNGWSGSGDVNTGNGAAEVIGSTSLSQLTQGVDISSKGTGTYTFCADLVSLPNQGNNMVMFIEQESNTLVIPDGNSVQCVNGEVTDGTASLTIRVPGGNNGIRSTGVKLYFEQ